MMVELKPETERLVQEEIRNGHVQSVDELIVFAVRALREKHQVEHASAAVAGPQKPRKHLYELLTQPPFAGSELNLERQKEYPRPVDLRPVFCSIPIRQTLSAELTSPDKKSRICLRLRSEKPRPASP
jgi:hypothetical protein